MKITKLFILPLLLVIVLLILISTWRMSPLFNLDYDISNQTFGECLSVEAPQLVGAEDLTVDLQTGFTYIGTDERRRYLTKGKNINQKGLLWVKDLNQRDARPTRIKANYPDIFHPHGIALLNKDNKKYLFVVNHLTTKQHQIDIFEITGFDTANLVNSISFPELISPNDLYPISTSKFYVTNDHGAPRQTFGEKLEDAFQLSNADVVLYDEGTVEVIIDNLALANGILVSDDETTLYVAESTAERISKFTKTEEAWQRSTSYELGVMPDNLEWDEYGNILTASHPQALAFLHHTFDASVTSPSIAHRINLSNGTNEVLYKDNGETLSGSSVAAEYKNHLLIGSVFEPRYIHCTKEAQTLASAN